MGELTEPTWYDEPPVEDDLPQWGAVDDELEQRLDFDRDVRDEARRLRVREAARDLIAAEKAAADPAPPFDAGTLDEILSRPQAPPYRVDGLIPADASTLVVAQRKVGKTTLDLNLVDSLITGAPFLGRFDVRPITGNVAVLNYEVSGHQLARWAADHGIPRNRLVLVNLRGRRNPLGHPEDRARLVEYLRGHHVESLLVDPFGRAYTGSSQNDSGEVGAWLSDLDRFTRAEVGATDLILTAHAGWNGERTRGASALEDWADVIVTMTKDDDDVRYLRAIGRDVDLDEDRLDFDHTSRTLTLAGTGSRAHAREDRKSAELSVLVLRAARNAPGLSYSAAEVAIKNMEDAPKFRNGDVAKAARDAADRGLLHIGSGPRGAASLTALNGASNV